MTTTAQRSKTLYLIDGHGQFFRAYHAIRTGMTSPVTQRSCGAVPRRRVHPAQSSSRGRRRGTDPVLREDGCRLSRENNRIRKVCVRGRSSGSPHASSLAWGRRIRNDGFLPVRLRGEDRRALGFHSSDSRDLCEPEPNVLGLHQAIATDAVSLARLLACPHLHP